MDLKRLEPEGSETDEALFRRGSIVAKNGKETSVGSWLTFGFSENFDEYMKEIGVSWALRKAGAMASSTTEISQEGDGIRVNTQSTVKSSNFVFPNGKAVDYTTMDGRKTKVSFSNDSMGTHI